MIFIKVFIIFFGLIVGLKFHFSYQRILPAVLLFFQLVFSNLFPIEIIQKVFGIFPIYAFGLYLGLMYKYRVKEIPKRKIIIPLIILITIFIFHNIIDFSNDSLKDEVDSILNRWGLLLSLLLVFNNSITRPFNKFENILFAKMILWFSYLYFFIVLLTMFGIVIGNTDKLLYGNGGVGLGSLSTNETALISVVFSLVLISNLELNGRFRMLTIVALILNIVTILLTQSRLGMISICTVILFNYVLEKGNLKYFPFYILLAFPFYNIFKQRSQVDIDRRLPVGLEWAYAGSGRLIIWAEYILSFFEKVSHSYPIFFFGTGYTVLYEIYLNTNLHTNGWVMNNVFFYPIHSDLLLLFFVGGIISVFIYFYLIVKTYKYSVKGKKYLVYSLILTMFLVFDMINYSPFSCLIFGNLMYQFNLHDNV